MPSPGLAAQNAAVLSTYEAMACFWDVHFGTQDEARFDEYEFQWTESQRWLEHADGFVPDWVDFDDEQCTALSSGQRDEHYASVISAETKLAWVSLEFRKTAGYQPRLSGGRQLAMWAHVRLPKPVRYDSLLHGVVKDVQDFISFFMGIPAVLVHAVACRNEPVDSGDSQALVTRVHPSGLRCESRADRFEDSSPLSNLDDVAPHFAESMNWWLGRSAEWRHITNALISGHYAELFLEDVVLRTGGALEALHREVYSKSGLLGKDVFAGLRGKIEDAVDACRLGEVASTIKDRLGGLNNPELKTRYSEIISRMVEVTALPAEQAEVAETAGELARLRNNLAHVNKRGLIDDDNVGRAGELANAMQALLEGCLLLRMGLDEPGVQRILRESHRTAALEKALRPKPPTLRYAAMPT